MATFLRNQRKKSEPVAPKPAVNGTAPEPATNTPETNRRVVREVKEENNTTEYEVLIVSR